MNNINKKIAIIGAGPMGLMTAYELLKKGYQVTVFELDDRIGGMSASFDFDGTKIERFYHFICKPDQPMFELLQEFNIFDRLKWRNTKMGFYYQGTLYPWGDPISLLTFPKLDFITKLRYGLMVKKTVKKHNWDKLDSIGVTDWLKKQIGEKGYNVLWKSLFHFKFYQYKDNLSALWLSARIRRIGLSRKNILRESLGYLEGGSDILLNKMAEKIVELGGAIKLQSFVSEIVAKNNKIYGIRTGNDLIEFDYVVSTIPLPGLKKIATCLPEDELKKIFSMIHVGVICVLFKLKYSLTKNFWLNINDSAMEIPGIIEYTNLNPSDEKIIYIPYYMPHDHSKFQWNDNQFVTEVITYLKKINREFSEDWILGTHVARYGCAQVVCPPGFYDQLPSVESKLKGFFMADTSYCYPEDRSISESIKIGKELAKKIYEKSISGSI